MALAERPAALPELSGRGVQTLAKRIAAWGDRRRPAPWSLAGVGCSGAIRRGGAVRPWSPLR